MDGPNSHPLPSLKSMLCSPNIGAIAVAGLLTASAATADTITVCSSGCQYTSINAAIDAASDGDVIQLAAETYTEGAVIDTDGKAIKLLGSKDRNGAAASTLDGAGSHGVLQCSGGENGSTVFENLVIQNGLTLRGGGLQTYDQSNPTLTNCAFKSNSAASRGGGVYSSASSPTLNDCTFTDNSAAEYGGGMYSSSSTPILTGCTFTTNSAPVGGALYNDFSGPVLIDCTLAGNSGDLGGAMYNEFSSPHLMNCGFTGNSAGFGDGLYNSALSTPVLTGCTFAECCQIDRPGSIVDAGGNDYDAWCDDCRADVNCRDDAVNSADLGYLLAAWGTTDPQCDLDGDGFVLAGDLGLLLGSWGPCD